MEMCRVVARLWTIGNLARSGYMAYNEDVWPYIYGHVMLVSMQINHLSTVFHICLVKD